MPRPLDWFLPTAEAYLCAPKGVGQNQNLCNIIIELKSSCKCLTDVIGVCDNGFMLIELVERLDAAASELLACLKRGEASSEELLGVLSGTKAVRGKVDTAQALAAVGVAGSRNHGDGGAHVLAESTGSVP